MSNRILYRDLRMLRNVRRFTKLTPQPDATLYLYQSKESIIHPTMSCKVAFPPWALIAR